MPSPKKQKSKLRKNNKPEVSYRVIPKKAIPNKSKPKKTAKKNNKLAKYLNNNKIHILAFLLIVLLIALVWVFVTKSISNTIESYNSIQQSAKSFNIVDKGQIVTASIVGSDDQLSREIENYQSAPEDLRAFAVKDYRSFKSSCVVNGKLIGPVNYSIENVVYDQFARVKRTCISDDSAIIAKIGGRWAIVTSGNALPECRVVNDLKLPQGVTFNCTDGMVIYTNPNP